jgi:hypothetical protein
MKKVGRVGGKALLYFEVVSTFALAIGLIVAVLVAALSIYLYLKATPYQTEIDHGPSPEAQANPYLAAEYFLGKQGLNVSHANSLDILVATY